MNTYYNTNNEVGEELETSKERALRQQNRILSYFQTFPKENFSPQDVWKALYGDKTPITSVRRAITNLTAAGKLIKTDFWKISDYGKRCHTWCAAPERFI
jgi:Fe2+ or Zn2+ uptake regulation protein